MTNTRRPKTAKKFETMNYLTPTKSVLAETPEIVHLYPSKDIKITRSINKSRRKSKSVRNLKTIKSVGRSSVKIRNSGQRKRQFNRRLSAYDIK